MTLLLRRRCDSGLLEDKRIKLCHLARVSANSVLPFALSARAAVTASWKLVTFSAASAWLQPVDQHPSLKEMEHSLALVLASLEP